MRTEGATFIVPPIASLDEGRLFGAFYGARPPKVIGLHGWGRTHRDFDKAFSGLAALSIDLPGFGASPPPDSAWGSAEYAQCVAEALAKLGERFVVVGHSFGGRVALRLAQFHPEMVCALVLTGTPLLRSGRKPRARLGYRLARALSKLGVISEEGLERAKRRYGSADYRAAKGTMRDVLVRVVNEDYSEILGSIRCQVTLVWGSEDAVVPVEVARRAEGMFPSAALRILQGEDHYSVLGLSQFREVVEEAEERVESPRSHT